MPGRWRSECRHGTRCRLAPSAAASGKAYIPGLFYTYGIQIVLTANQQQQQTINILNAPFKWIFATAVSTGAFTVQLADAKNLRGSSLTPQLHNALVFGTAQNPFPVLNPWTFDQNGAIQINITDLSGAGNTVWLGFIGVQIIQSSTQGKLDRRA